MYEVFQSDKDGKWYWHSVRAGCITADSGGGYGRKSDALRALRREVAKAVKLAPTLDKHIRVIERP